MAGINPPTYQIDVYQSYVTAVLRYEKLNAQRLFDRYARTRAVRVARIRSKAETIGHDILSIIFEFCAEVDWASPLDIAEVCRTWRITILSTPKAWSHVDLVSPLPEKCIRLFFERSGRHPLHLCVPYARTSDLLTPVAHRLVCLNLQNMTHHPKDIVFPLLTRLRIHVVGPLPACYITIHQFPALRHLMVWNTWLVGPLDEETFPVLSSLAVCVSPSDRTWIDVIIATRRSLVSLTVVKSARMVQSIRLCEITLPRLRNLDVWDWSKGLPCPLALRTPHLTTYAEHAAWLITGPPILADVSTVTHARLSRPPDLGRFESLTHLQYVGSGEHCVSLLRQLENACPTLAFLDYYNKLLDAKEVSTIQSLGCDLARETPIRIVFSELTDPLPGILPVYTATDEYKCGHGWHPA